MKSFRAQFYLGGRFLTADVDDFTGAGQPRRDLQQERRFSRARRSADQRQAAGNETAAEDGIDLGMSTRRRASFAPSISRKGTGTGAPGLGIVFAPRAGATAKGRSSNEFQAWHCGQRPSQRGDSDPHAEQK